MLHVARMAITYIKHFSSRANMSGIILKTVRFYSKLHTYPYKIFYLTSNVILKDFFQENTVIINTEGEWQKLLNKVDIMHYI